ncbi:MAG: hypothetical protein ACRD51_16410 [Candidatus Acidiferrum sp.]
MRNISDQPASLTPELWWMSGGSPHSATLPQIALAPHQTVNLNAPALLAAAGLKNFNGSVNLILDTTAQAGGLLMSSGSVDQTNTYVFEVMPHGIAEGPSKSLCYWSTGNGDDTMVTLWNPADEAQDLAFTLFYSGGQYVYPIHLGPRETRTMNVSDIVHTSIPDAAGNVIPAGLTEGSAEIAGSLGEQQQILISLDVATYNVRKATCGVVCWECDGIIYAAIDLSPFAVAVGGTTGETFYETRNTGYQYAESATWRSSATSVATVNTTGVVSGVRTGSLTLYANDLYPETDGVGWYCTDIYYYCPTSYFNASTNGGSAPPPNVTFGYTPVVPLNGTATMTATVTGNTMSAPIGLLIATDAGTTGQAIFSDTGNNLKTITQTTTLLIRGTQASSVPNNIELSAGFGNTSLATTYFTVAATSGPIPVNFRQTSAYPSNPALINFTYVWDSSSGNVADLSNCQVQELVTYPNQPSHPGSFLFPSPPYVANYDRPNPDTGLTPVSATNGLNGLIDTQGNPGFAPPYQSNSFSASQVFQFQCSNYKVGQWIQFFPQSGNLSIIRTVQQVNGQWQYTVSKSGLSNTGVLP